MKKLIILFLIISFNAFGQIDYLSEGNKYLNQNKNVEAEKLFREAIKSDNNNLIFKCQLALSLINQKKHSEAETEISEVLVKDSLNVAALWYGGINNFQNKDFKKSVHYFEKAFPKINKNSPQYSAINFYIGKNYSNLLYSDGLSYYETDRMLETYKEYIKLQPNGEEIPDLESFVIKIKKQRPPKNVLKWTITTEENLNEMIEKQVGK
jgi:tetratricopeptide (TPR) repeat protein